MTQVRMLVMTAANSASSSLIGSCQGRAASISAPRLGADDGTVELSADLNKFLPARTGTAPGTATVGFTGPNARYKRSSSPSRNPAQDFHS